MAVALNDLKQYVGDDLEDDTNDALLTGCLEDAAVLLDKYVGEAAVPDSILDRCTLIVAYDLFERRNAPNGIVNTQFATVDGIGQSPARIARDPLAGVYHLLGRWILPW